MGIAVQSQIAASYRLLHAGFVYEGLALDLHGTQDADGAEVCAVSLAGSRVDLESVIDTKIIQRAQDWLDAHSDRLIEQDRQQARVDSYLFERMLV